MRISYHPDETLRELKWERGARLQRTLPSTDSQRFRIHGPDGTLLEDSEAIHRDLLGFLWADGPERFVYDGHGRLVIAAQRRSCDECRLEAAYDPFDNLTNTYRDERFDWWLEVDSKNRLRHPPGDDGGRLDYSPSGRLTHLRWSWQDPPPALQSLAFGYGPDGGLLLLRAGPEGAPLRDWWLIPGPQGRPAVIVEGYAGTAHLAFRDLHQRPMSLWKVALSPKTTAPPPGFELEAELFYGPSGLLRIEAREKESREKGPRYLLRNDTGSVRYGLTEDGEILETPLYYPFGEPLGNRDPRLFYPSFGGHETLPEGLTLSPGGRPYSPQISRFLTPGREAGVWSLYGVLPPQISLEGATRDSRILGFNFGLYRGWVQKSFPGDRAPLARDPAADPDSDPASDRVGLP